MLFNENAIKNKIQTYKMSFLKFIHDVGHSKENAQKDWEIDKAVKDSFPASDPAGFRSTSVEDKNHHPTQH